MNRDYKIYTGLFLENGQAYPRDIYDEFVL